MLLITIYFVSLAIILLFSLQNLILYLLSFLSNKKQVKFEVQESDLPFVTIQLPIFNEGRFAARIIDSCCLLDYPKDKLQIQVLDDSTDNTTDIARRKVSQLKTGGFDIELIHRNNRDGFKAGALSNAMITAKGEFIAVFDADFIPNVSFLRNLMPYFANKSTGFIQTSWQHNNASTSILTYLQDLRLKSHFYAGQKPRNANNLLISFDGSSGIWRRTCIENSGNWQSDTLAEDMDIALRAQIMGWQGNFVEEYFSSAELPISINSFKSQQFRWTKGVTEVASKLGKDLIKSGIPLINKIDTYLRLISNIVFPLVLIISLLNVPVYMFLRETYEYNDYVHIMPVFLLALLTAFLTLVLINKKAPVVILKRILVFPLFLSGITGLSVSNSIAFFEGILGIKSPFVRTDKSEYIIKKANKSRKQFCIGLAELAFAFYSLLGLHYFVLAGDYISVFFQALVAFGYSMFAYNSLLK